MQEKIINLDDSNKNRLKCLFTRLYYFVKTFIKKSGFN